MQLNDLLEASLLDLLYELRDSDLPLILAGGYGLYRKRRQAEQTGARLLIEAVPPVRSTSDLDLFLRTEIIADHDQAVRFRAALDRLGYVVIEHAKYYQFVRRLDLGGRLREVKIDLLAKQPDVQQYPMLTFDDRRVKPKLSAQLHAHTTKEAIAIEDEPIVVLISGPRTTGENYDGVIYLPQTYPYLMMKLFAFRDQCNNDRKGFGREHALDLYTLISIMTEEEYYKTLELARRYSATDVAREASQITLSHFRDSNSLGAIRLREHQLFFPEMDVLRGY